MYIVHCTVYTSKQVCALVCERERERETDRVCCVKSVCKDYERERERERDSVRQREYCVKECM